MGIRIHKMLGYGLTDVETKDGEISDIRINKNSFLLDDDVYEDTFDSRDDEIKSFQDYLAALPDEERAEIIWGYSDKDIKKFVKKYYGFNTLVAYDDEGGLDNVLCTAPMDMVSECVRNDDLIDYTESALNDSHGEPDVKEIINGFYPWSGSFTDTRTGKMARVPPGFSRSRKAILEGTNDDNDYKILDLLVKHLGYKDGAEALSYLVPYIPPGHVHFLKWANIFTDEKYIQDLRPILYTYWA
jgi:hypothetical protein